MLLDKIKSVENQLQVLLNVSTIRHRYYTYGEAILFDCGKDKVVVFDEKCENLTHIFSYAMEYRSNEFGGKYFCVTSVNTNMCAIMSKHGNLLCNLEYDKIGVFKFGTSVSKKHGTEWFIINTNFAVVSEEYEYISDYIIGKYRMVFNENKTGIMDNNGKMVTPFLNEDIVDFYDNEDNFVIKFGTNGVITNIYYMPK